jgi:Cu-processing system ATP-binding protein
MISIVGLTKRFGRLDVLRGIDLTVERGRVTAILGPNGAGKSTLIKCVLGLVRPDGGTILVDGRPALADPALRSRIGYMPQTPRLPDNLTAADLLALVRDLRGPTAATSEAMIDALSLGPELRKPLRTLSGGTRQKVNAVIAFLFRPDLLILDEPTAGLDPLASSTLKDAILAERAAGRTTIVTSHILSDLEELADDVVFLLDGRVRYRGELQRLKGETRQPTLERAIASLIREHGGLPVRESASSSAGEAAGSSRIPPEVAA